MDAAKPIKHTSSKKIEAAYLQLVEKTNRLNALMSDGLCFVDEHWRIQGLNPEASRIFGMTEKEAKYQFLFDIIEMFEPHHEKKVLQDELEAALLEGNLYQEEECLFIRTDGSHIPVSFAINPTLTRGKFVGAAILLMDISRQKKIEDSLLQKTCDTEKENHTLRNRHIQRETHTHTEIERHTH